MFKCLGVLLMSVAPLLAAVDVDVFSRHVWRGQEGRLLCLYSLRSQSPSTTMSAQQIYRYGARSLSLGQIRSTTSFCRSRCRNTVPYP